MYDTYIFMYVYVHTGVCTFDTPVPAVATVSLFLLQMAADKARVEPHNPLQSTEGAKNTALPAKQWGGWEAIDSPRAVAQIARHVKSPGPRGSPQTFSPTVRTHQLAGPMACWMVCRGETAIFLRLTLLPGVPFGRKAGLSFCSRRSTTDRNPPMFFSGGHQGPIFVIKLPKNKPSPPNKNPLTAQRG